MVTYNCTTEDFTINNDAFAAELPEFTIKVTMLGTDCTGSDVDVDLIEGDNFEYSLNNAIFSGETSLNGDGVYLFEYTYDGVQYSSCTLVLCTGKCDIYNAIYDNIGTCNCKDSDLDKAYNIFMHTSIAQSLTECDDCCKAAEVYYNLLTLINGCTTC